MTAGDTPAPALQRWEISNPSDKLVIEAPTFLAAAVATLLLGGGAYGLVDNAGDQVLPIFILGGADAWIEEHVGSDFPGWLKAHSSEVADALATVKIPDRGERSSMNDIAGRAARLAARLRNPAGAA